MAYESDGKIDRYAQAVRGLLEPAAERQEKYLDFIDIDTDLDKNEKKI